MKYTIGCDPEGFVFDKVKAQYVSAHDLIPGTKLLPHAVKYGAVQRDGVAAEFNIIPATTLNEFTRNIFTTFNELQRMVRSKSKDYTLVFDPTATFSKEYFDGLPPYTKELGCTPDWDAYHCIPNDKPHTDEPFRTGAGHIHIGWAEQGEHFNPDEDHIATCASVVKQLDVALYVPSLLWDSDEKRRELYGKIGAFRPKPYGLEYRPLSNKWVTDPLLHKYIFNTIQKAMTHFDNGVLYYDVEEYETNVNVLRKGFHLTPEEIREQYWDMVTTGLCERLPPKYATVG